MQNLDLRMKTNAKQSDKEASFFLNTISLILWVYENNINIFYVQHQSISVLGGPRGNSYAYLMKFAF
jgi:hypothetical protein